jgi:GTP-binding protein
MSTRLVPIIRLLLRYITQANTRPPTLALFLSKPGDLPGVPIRLMLRKGANPFAGRD